MAVEVDGGDGQAEVVQLGEIAGAEVLPPSRSIHCVTAELLEQQEHQAVDPEHRTWALVADNLSPYVYPYKRFIRLEPRAALNSVHID